MATIRKAIYPSPVYAVKFADGATARFSVWQPKPLDWDWDHCRRVIDGCVRSGPGRYGPGSRLYGKVQVAGQLEWQGRVWLDPQFHPEAAESASEKPRRRAYKATLAALLAYLDGEHDDESVIEAARAAVA